MKTASTKRAIDWDLAGVYAGLGERERALDLIEAAFQRRSVDMIWLNVDYRFADLHAEPRFIALRHQIKLD
jgi:hypothetical protein